MHARVQGKAGKASRRACAGAKAAGVAAREAQAQNMITDWRVRRREEIQTEEDCIKISQSQE